MIMIIRKIPGVRVERRELQQNAALLLVPPPALTEVGPVLLKRGPCFEIYIAFHSRVTQSESFAFKCFINVTVELLCPDLPWEDSVLTRGRTLGSSQRWRRPMRTGCQSFKDYIYVFYCIQLRDWYKNMITPLVSSKLVSFQISI